MCPGFLARGGSRHRLFRLAGASRDASSRRAALHCNSVPSLSDRRLGLLSRLGKGREISPVRRDRRRMLRGKGGIESLYFETCCL